MQLELRVLHLTPSATMETIPLKDEEVNSAKEQVKHWETACRYQHYDAPVYLPNGESKRCGDIGAMYIRCILEHTTQKSLRKYTDGRISI